MGERVCRPAAVRQEEERNGAQPADQQTGG